MTKWLSALPVLALSFNQLLAYKVTWEPGGTKPIQVWIHKVGACSDFRLNPTLGEPWSTFLVTGYTETSDSCPGVCFSDVIIDVPAAKHEWGLLRYSCHIRYSACSNITIAWSAEKETYLVSYFNGINDKNIQMDREGIAWSEFGYR